MSSLIFLKTAGDVCLYFTVIGAFPDLFDCGISFIWPVVLCGGGAAVASALDQMGHYRLRFLGILIPLSAFALTKSFMDQLVLIPAMVYCAAVILRGAFSLEYYDFRGRFQRTLKIWFVLFLALLGAYALDTEMRPWSTTFAVDLPLRFGLLYCVCGILIQRRLRLGEERRPLSGKQSAMLAAGSSGAMLMLVGLERLLQTYSSSIGDIIGNALKYMVSIPILILGWLVQFLMGMDDKVLEEIEKHDATAPTESTPLGGMPSADSGTPGLEVPQESGFPWLAVIGILVVLTVVLICMLRVLQKSPKGQSSHRRVQKVAPEKSERTDHPRSNRSKVRRAYRSYLRSQRKRGVKLRTDQTSLDILNQTAGNRDSAAKLRQIYLFARYNDNCTVTAEQVKAAQDTLKEM